MEETRASLADKLEALESQVRDTVQTATDAVSSTVGGVKEAVSSVTETVETVSEKVTETFDDVKDKVTETVHSVAEALDVGRYVENNPWTAVGVSVAVGFAAGALLPSVGQLAHGAPSGSTTPTPPSGAYGAGAATGPSWTSELTSSLGQVWHSASGTLQGLAVGTVLGVVRELLARNVPDEWQGELTRMVDNVTNQLGGKPMKGDWLNELLAGRHNGHGTQQGATPPADRRETFTPRANV